MRATDVEGSSHMVFHTGTRRRNIRHAFHFKLKQRFATAVSVRSHCGAAAGARGSAMESTAAIGLYYKRSGFQSETKICIFQNISKYFNEKNTRVISNAATAHDSGRYYIRRQHTAGPTQFFRPTPHARQRAANRNRGETTRNHLHSGLSCPNKIRHWGLPVPDICTGR